MRGNWVSFSFPPLKHPIDSNLGTYAVALNEGHFKELMLDLVPPLPVTEQMQLLYGSNMMMMGFPNRVEEEANSLCAEYVQPEFVPHIQAPDPHPAMVPLPRSATSVLDVVARFARFLWTARSAP